MTSLSFLSSSLVLCEVFFSISSTTAIDNAGFLVGIAIGAFFLEEASQSSKISVLFMSAIKSFDSSLNLLTSASGSSPEGRILCSGGSRTAQSTS